MTEKELYHQIKTGTPDEAERALLRLVSDNVDKLWPAARAIAAQTDGKWTAEDLYQEGALAMVRFAERWKPVNGARFFTAAFPRSRGAMKDFLRRRADTMRGGLGQPLSIDAEAGDDDTRTLGDTIAAPEPDEQPATLPETINDLERSVLDAVLFRVPPLSLRETARALKLKPATVKQAHRRAMFKIHADA